MKTLHKMILSDFFPTFLVSLSFFSMVIQLLDIFGNLWRYLNQNVPMTKVAYLALLYMPKCVSYAFPISVLFAVSYILGQYYSRNELIAVFGSGQSLFRFVLPLLILGIFFSFGIFFFENNLVIPTYRQKKELSRFLLGQQPSLNSSQVAIMSHGGQIVYYSGFYNNETLVLSDVTVIERDKNNGFIRRLESDSVQWDKEKEFWRFSNCRIFSMDSNRDIDMSFYTSYSDQMFNEIPDTFQNKVKEVNELEWSKALDWIKVLKRSGLPFRESLTDLYSRLAFSLTPLVVILLSCAMGGRFKKNVLLMSLLYSLILAVGYYITQMITVLMAKLGTLSPLMGAFLGVFFFLSLGIVLFRRART